jgi:membrane protease YdiL (CAAX protease family)
MNLPTLTAAGLIALSLVGGAIAIPLAQELAFRGYLERRLVASDFTLRSVYLAVVPGIFGCVRRH